MFDCGLDFRRVRGAGVGGVLVWFEGRGRGVGHAVGEEVAEVVEGGDEGFFFEEGEGLVDGSEGVGLQFRGDGTVGLIEKDVD